MGMYYSAYHFYGAHVPSDQWVEAYAWPEGERLDPIIGELGLGDKSVHFGHLEAGRYDQDQLFLCVSIEDVSAEVSLGSFRLSPKIAATPEWDKALTMIASAAGYDVGKLVFGWITVPDLS